MKIRDYIKELHLRMTYKDWWRWFRDVPFHVAREVEHQRIMRHMTQRELAIAIGTHQPSIARLERGTTLPSLRLLAKIARALGCVLEVRLIPFREAVAKEMWPIKKLSDGTVIDFTSRDTVTFESTLTM